MSVEQRRATFESEDLLARRFTPREEQILGLIAADRSDKEVARMLGISRHTLRTHLCRLFVRHGLHSRAAAVAVWILATNANGNGHRSSSAFES